MTISTYNKHHYIELGSDGTEIGRRPETISVAALSELGHHKQPITKVVRAMCLECCGHESVEVRKCTAITCPLWPYRMGKNIFTGRKGNYKKGESND